MNFYWDLGLWIHFFRLQAFLDFHDFNYRGFPFTAVYNSIICSSPLVLLSNLDLHSLCFRFFFFCVPTNSVNRGLSVKKEDQLSNFVLLKETTDMSCISLPLRRFQSFGNFSSNWWSLNGDFAKDLATMWRASGACNSKTDSSL